MKAIMRRDLLRTGAFALAFASSFGISAAQQPPPPADAQQPWQQDNAQQTPSGKMGKEEPSSHAATAQPQQNAVFVNGALAVPDAPANTDTVPAKFSQKNAADDELITIAYTFKTLGDDERRAWGSSPAPLSTQISGRSCRPGSSCVRCPMTLPRVCRKPRIIAARVPQTKDYSYAVTHDRVLLVGTSRVVAGVFADANVPVSQGRRGP